LSARASYNAVRKKMPMTNKKNGAYSMDFNLNMIMDIKKHKDCSLNDYIVSCYSNTLYQYFDSKKD
jgi:hypothetical protein